MPVQITPYNPVSLSDLAINKRDFNAQQNQLGVQNAQNDRRLDQGDQSLKISTAQLRAAARKAKMDEVKFLNDVTLDIAAQSAGPEETFNYLTNAIDVPQEALEDFKRSVYSLPQGAYGSELPENQFSAPRDVIGPDGRPAIGQVSDAGQIRIAEGGTPTPKTGQTFKVSPDGTIVFSSGGDQDLTTKNVSDLQSKNIELGDTLVQLRTIETQFDPKFHTIQERFDATVTKWKAKAGFEISAEDKEAFEEFADYRATSANVQSQVIKQMSGAAVNEAEEKRLKGFLIDPGTGIFDGDDPLSAERKLVQFTRLTEIAKARTAYILSQGRIPNEAEFDALPLDAMPKIMSRRFEVLSEVVGPEKAREALAKEFGL